MGYNMQNQQNQIEITIDLTKLRKNGLFVATPMYGGACAGIFTKSMNDLSRLCEHHKIPLQIYYLFNESLVQRARNYCADEFLRSPYNHLMFIDSDIGFDPRDILTFMALQSSNEEYDVMGGPYPKKCISWEKIKQAVDKGIADNDPNILEQFVGDYVFNPANGSNQIPLFKPAEVSETGTGFMMITRNILEKFKNTYKELSYRPDHVRTKNFDGSREITAFFHCIITPEEEGKRYLSEDYMFCYYVRKMGGKVWLCPWMRLQHVGTYMFGGSLVDLAGIGAAPTADPSKLKKS